MHVERAPEVPELITTLATHRLRDIVGSVAAALYGVETPPGDLDITLPWTATSCCA